MIKVYHSLSSPPEIWGIRLQEFSLLLIVSIGFLIGGAIAKSFIYISGLYYLFVSIITIICYITILIGNSKDHPSFLFSTISTWFQPLEIDMTYADIEEIFHKDI